MKYRPILRPAEISLLAATIGISTSAVIFEGSAAIYYISVATAGVLSLLDMWRRKLLAERPGIIIIIVTTWLIAAMAIRDIFGIAPWGMVHASDITVDTLKILAITVLLALSASSGAMSNWLFERTMIVVALAHVALLAYGVSSGEAAPRVLSDSDEVVRLSSAGVATAAWAEIALGTAMAAVLSRRRWVMIIAIPAALYTILAADMRTTLLAVALMTFILIIGALASVRRLKHRLLILSALGGLSLIIAQSFAQSISSAVSDLLLLEDAHRGLQSGFSGRFENFSAGWDAFLQNTLLGSGFSNPLINYTHNGYLLTLAQMGAPISLLLIFLLVKSWLSALSNRDFTLMAVIAGLALFYMGQPRNINFQLCPLLGIISCSRSLLSFDLSKITGASPKAGYRKRWRQEVQ